MELKRILKILWQEKSIILGITVLVVVISMFFSLFQPFQYQVYLDVETKRMNRPLTQDYQYDEYYAIQSANLMTDTINSWFRSKNFNQEILIEAGFDQNNLPAPSKFFKTRKLSAQNLEIKILTDNRKTATTLAKIVKDAVSNRVQKINVDQTGEPTFRTDIRISQVEIVRINVPLLLLASFIGGLLLGIFLALLLHYFRK